MDDRGERPSPGCWFLKGRSKGQPQEEVAEPVVRQWVESELVGITPPLATIPRKPGISTKHAVKIKSHLSANVFSTNSHQQRGDNQALVVLYCRRLTWLMCAVIMVTPHMCQIKAQNLKKRKQNTPLQKKREDVAAAEMPKELQLRCDTAASERVCKEENKKGSFVPTGV